MELKRIGITCFLIMIFKGFKSFMIENNCIYNEEFLEYDWDDDLITISFYVPFNWITWNFNDELTIAIGNATFVLRHPLKHRDQSINNPSLQIEILPILDSLSIGWNVVSVKRSSELDKFGDFDQFNEITIESQFGQILSRKSCSNFNCSEVIRVNGLFATANCKSVYRYYLTSNSSVVYRIPLIISSAENTYTIYSNLTTKSFAINVLYSARKKLLLCEENYYNFFITESCNESEKEYFVPNIYYNIRWTRMFENQKYFSFDDFNVTDFYLHNKDLKLFYVKIRTYKYFNISFNRLLPPTAENFDFSKETIIHVFLHGISFAFIAILIILCLKERRRRINFEIMQDKNQGATTVEIVDEESSGSEIKNDLYVDFNTRMSKLVLKDEKEQENSSDKNAKNEYENIIKAEYANVK